MLTEQRYEQILKLLEKEGSITVTEVKELLNISESTAELFHAETEGRISGYTLDLSSGETGTGAG